MTLPPYLLDALAAVQPILWSIVAAGVATLVTMCIADDLP